MARRDTGTRIAIIVIAIMMVVGTIGSFAVIILQNENQAEESRRLNEMQVKWQKEQEEYQKKLDAQAAELSKKYYTEFSRYKDKPARYDKDSVKELQKKDLKKGNGETIKGDTKFAAYYLGWNSDGKVFDGSFDDESLTSPLRIDDGLDQAMLIEGWREGMKGMKIGGVRELAIPSDLAYGETGSGDDIPPNTPIKFVVMAIKLPKEIPRPEMPEEMMRGLYGGF